MSVKIVGGNSYILNTSLTFKLTNVSLPGYNQSEKVILTGKYGSRSSSSKDISSIYQKNSGSDLFGVTVVLSTDSSIQIKARCGSESSSSSTSGTYTINFANDPFTVSY